MKPCRTRSRDMLTADESAILRLSRMNLATLESAVKRTGKPASSTIAELLDRSETIGFVLLNHAVAYLENRAGYPALRRELYAGLLEVD